jgi:hypothetical protein
MRFKLIVLMMIMLSWMRDLPVDLYPGAPPSVQIRGMPAIDPLNRGISQQELLYAQINGKDLAGKQDDSTGDGSIAADEDNGLPPLEKLLLPTLYLEVKTEKHKNSALTTWATGKTSFLDGSESSMLQQSSLLGHPGGSKGTCINSIPLQTKQLLKDAQSSQSDLAMTMTMTMTMTMMILIVRATEASPTIQMLTVPVENLAHLLL